MLLVFFKKRLLLWRICRAIHLLGDSHNLWIDLQINIFLSFWTNLTRLLTLKQSLNQKDLKAIHICTPLLFDKAFLIQFLHCLLVPISNNLEPILFLFNLLFHPLIINIFFQGLYELIDIIRFKIFILTSF